MIDLDSEEYRREIHEKYKALNVMVGELLIEQELDSSKIDDLAYYNRLVAETKIELKRLMGVKSKEVA